MAAIAKAKHAPITRTLCHRPKYCTNQARTRTLSVENYAVSFPLRLRCCCYVHVNINIACSPRARRVSDQRLFADADVRCCDLKTFHRVRRRACALVRVYVHISSGNLNKLCGHMQWSAAATTLTTLSTKAATATVRAMQRQHTSHTQGPVDGDHRARAHA